jgi:peptide/nickel transport system permease protein
MGYLVRRFLHSLVLFFGVSIFVFVLLALAPGDFFSEMRLTPALSANSVEQLRIQNDLHRPLPVRYFHWAQSVLRGDWGRSLAYQVPVWPLLRVRAANTLLLTITATTLAWALALLLGIAAAVQPGGWIDRLVGATTSVLLGLPDILLCLLLLMWALHTHVLPVGGMTAVDSESFSRSQQAGDVLRHMVLPVVALVLISLPTLVRHVRTSMKDALAADAIRTTRAAGVSRPRTLLVHALPLAANPLISLLGLSIATLLSGSLLVEFVFGWPGLGPLLLEAILARDVYVVIGAVMLSTLFLVAGNFCADILLAIVDPRLREGSA